VNVWTGYRTRFPDSPYVDEVEEYWQRSRNRLATKELYIARFYARRGTWSAARDRAEGLLKRYPDSEPAPEALALVARSQHAWGDVEGATQTRGRLASEYPESRELVRLDRHLGKTPGEPPEEQIFTRPYRYPGMTMPGMGAY